MSLIFKEKKFIPTYYVDSINDIDYQELYDKGARCIFADLDNTLISYAKTDSTPELMCWKKSVEAIGFEVIIVSNSRKNRVDHFSEQLEIKHIKFATKPLKRGFKKAMKITNQKYKREEIIAMGDQLMTDIWGANRMGFISVLVKAIDKKTEIWTTRLNRKWERYVLKKVRRKLPDLYNEKLRKYDEDNYGRN